MLSEKFFQMNRLPVPYPANAENLLNGMKALFAVCHCIRNLQRIRRIRPAQ